ncbi:ribonuclease III [Lichenicoccus sp.]|uniref:ribonuclease III n=1 Tax=Lichenicoccus sp. TaxID=2781899 RepID=UPI003D117974
MGPLEQLARARIEALLGEPFKRPALLAEALTHRSAAHERQKGARGGGSNERLEFIGDRVLGLLMAEWLIERFPNEQEGALGPRHAYLVSRPVLARVAGEIGLAAALDVAPHEARAGIREVANVLADAVEAVLGAAYLDGGLEAPRRFVRAAWDEAMLGQTLPPKDPKTALQEWLLGRGLALPVYKVVSAEGPSHAPRFAIEVGARGCVGAGMAGSKRAAESAAAADLLRQLQ